MLRPGDAQCSPSTASHNAATPPSQATATPASQGGLPPLHRCDPGNPHFWCCSNVKSVQSVADSLPGAGQAVTHLALLRSEVCGVHVQAACSQSVTHASHAGGCGFPSAWRDPLRWGMHAHRLPPCFGILSAPHAPSVASCRLGSCPWQPCDYFNIHHDSALAITEAALAAVLGLHRHCHPWAAPNCVSRSGCAPAGDADMWMADPVSATSSPQAASMPPASATEIQGVQPQVCCSCRESLLLWLFFILCFGMPE